MDDSIRMLVSRLGTLDDPHQAGKVMFPQGGPSGTGGCRRHRRRHRQSSITIGPVIHIPVRIVKPRVAVRPNRRAVGRPC
jgi:hypothetical protein